MARTNLNSTNYNPLHPRNALKNNTNVSTISNSISNDSAANNVSMDNQLNEIQTLLDQIEELMGGSDVEIEMDDFDDQFWSDILEGLLHGEVNDNDIESEECAMIENAQPVVNRNDLFIGELKKARQEMAVTKGWNSPNAGIGGTHVDGNLGQTITFSNSNGGAVDLSSLFAGNGASNSFTFSGSNIQINNGHIVFENNDGSQQEVNSNLNNNQVMIDNALLSNPQQIPEMVPFTQIMNSATVAVIGLDGNGNWINVGNSLGSNINIAQLLNTQNKPNSKP